MTPSLDLQQNFDTVFRGIFTSKSGECRNDRGYFTEGIEGNERREARKREGKEKDGALVSYALMRPEAASCSKTAIGDAFELVKGRQSDLLRGMYEERISREGERLCTFHLAFTGVF